MPRSGLSYLSDGRRIPELEARLAAKAFHYTWEQFCELPGESQSAVVAAYRSEIRIEALVAYDNRPRPRPKAHR